ncbi:MAG: T9SS type A sorting domain-containing protein [Elusimicrobia bacterium]|nr:T9SS type A sorting domain-containing protein [Elusimicrobiota bacterium]
MRTAPFVAAVLGLAATGARAAEPLLPDLISWAKEGRYMYDARIERNGSGRKLLKFSAAAANAGRGPFELRGVVRPDGTTTAFQRVYYDDGSFTDHDVGTFVFSGHAGHNHFHYAEFASYHVREVRGGDTVGRILRTSPKIGFAMWDVTSYDLRLPNAPAGPVYNRPDGMDRAPQGISVGWADIYDWNLDEQWVDITGLPDGDYWLDNTLDPGRRLRESSHGNNTTLLKFRLRGDTVAFSPAESPPQPQPGPVAVADLQVFPNPWRGDQHGGRSVKFLNLTDGAVVKIYTAAGRYLRTVTAQGGEASWNLTDDSGTTVPSGFYYYNLEAPGGRLKHGKLAVIK